MYKLTSVKLGNILSVPVKGGYSISSADDDDGATPFCLERFDSNSSADDESFF